MKKLLSLMLSLCLLLSCGLAGAETVKHERVYAVLDAAGEVQSLTDSIRLENQDALDVLTDRTMLTAVENVGGQETFTLDGEEISFQAAGKDITYQGSSDKAPAIIGDVQPFHQFPQAHGAAAVDVPLIIPIIEIHGIAEDKFREIFRVERESADRVLFDLGIVGCIENKFRVCDLLHAVMHMIQFEIMSADRVRQ